MGIHGKIGHRRTRIGHGENAGRPTINWVGGRKKGISKIFSRDETKTSLKLPTQDVQGWISDGAWPQALL